MHGSRSRGLFSPLALVLLSLASPSLVAASDATSTGGTATLFEVVGSKVYYLAPDDPAVVRRQTVTLATEPAALDALLDETSLPARLGIDLFAGERRVVRVESIERTILGPVLVGRVEDGAGEPIPDSTAFFALGDGSLTGNLSLPAGDGRPAAIYRVRPVPGGEIVLEAIDLDLRPPHVPPIPSSAVSSGDATDATESLAESPGTHKDGPGRIDVMVVYTGEARERSGGAAALEQRIAVGIAETNQVLAASGVETSVRLVHAQEISYAERGWDIGLDVQAIQRKNDGLMDDVHPLRDQYGADLVTLIGENRNGGCGIAYIMDGSNNAAFEEEAFAYVARGCLGGGFTFTHELGHNLGCNHAREDPVRPGAYDYSYGWKDPTGGFHTIMAYGCGGCGMVPRFSNPRQTQNGRPFGTTADDNARSIQGIRSVVANFRQEVGAPPPPPDDPGRVEWVSRNVTVGEADGTARLVARRVRGSDGVVSVGVRTFDESATAGEDYLAADDRLTWTDGESGEKAVEIVIVDDAEVEADEERFRVELVEPEGGVDLGPAGATVRVLENDEIPFEPFVCEDDATTLCLQGDPARFQVRLAFTTAALETGDGQVVPGVSSPDSGLFYLFEADNWEMLVKVLDGCAINGHYWVLAAATTDVGYVLEIVDSETGTTARYENPIGRAAPALVDTGALPVCVN